MHIYFKPLEFEHLRIARQGHQRSTHNLTIYTAIMALGVISPNFIKRSVSQPPRTQDRRLRSPGSNENSASPRQAPSASSRQAPSPSPSSAPTSSSPEQQFKVLKQRSVPKPVDTNARRTQSESLSRHNQDTTPEDQVASRKKDTTRRSQSCSLPRPIDETKLAVEEDEEVSSRSRLSSLQKSFQEGLKVDDRARTWGGVPGTELMVSGRQFWRSILGSSARVRETED